MDNHTLTVEGQAALDTVAAVARTIDPGTTVSLHHADSDGVVWFVTCRDILATRKLFVARKYDVETDFDNGGIYVTKTGENQ